MAAGTKGEQNQKPVRPSAWIFVLVILSILAGSYVTVRYGRFLGLDWDSSLFSAYIQAMAEDGSLTPGGSSYPHGYGYQALILGLMNLTGMSLFTIQFFGGTLLAVWTILMAWICYRELTGSSKAASLASLILLAQPEFLFPIMRGTHEKFTRGLMFLLLYLLARSIRSRGNISQFTGFVSAFYVAAFALISFNNLLASSFILACGLALVALRLIMDRQHPGPMVEQTLQRLGYAILGCTVIAVTYSLFLYSPARHDFFLTQNFVERLVSLFLEFESRSLVEPYRTISMGWISPQVYVILSLANWLVLGLSALIWLKWCFDWLRRRRRPGYHQAILWSFYGAFALILALSVALDMSGTFAGTNLQLRAFPALVMIAAPMIAVTMRAGLVRGHSMPGKNYESIQRRRVGLAVFGLLMGLLTIIAVVKITNEPLLSNQWRFYSTGEMAAVKRADVILAERALWTGYDNRLETAVEAQHLSAGLSVELDSWDVEPSTRNFLSSELLGVLQGRLGLASPVEGDSLVTYDNGQAQIYHLRPRTPFQQ